MGQLYHHTGSNGQQEYTQDPQKLNWEQWYPKYSPLIYGIILKLTGNKTRAGKILKEVIMELTRRHEVREGDHLVLCKLVFQQTYNYTLKHLHHRGMKPVSTKPFGENFPLLHLLYFDFKTIDELAGRQNKTKQEVLQDLRHEFKLLRNQNPGQMISSNP